MVNVVCLGHRLMFNQTCLKTTRGLIRTFALRGSQHTYMYTPDTKHML